MDKNIETKKPNHINDEEIEEIDVFADARIKDEEEHIVDPSKNKCNYEKRKKIIKRCFR